MSKFTLKEFRKQFPNDYACIERIFQIRYGNLTACPSCACPAAWRRIKTRRCYQCRHCYTQFYPTAGTVFEKTTTSIQDWFYVIFMFTTTRNGVAAKEIERQLGVGYKTAWRIGHQVRKLMEKIGMDKLKNFVEFDETYVKKGKPIPGRSANDKDSTPVFGMVERMGEVRAFALPNVQKETIYPIIEKHIDKSAKVSTDEFALYTNLNSELGLDHGAIKHQLKIYRIGSISTNTIEGYFSQLKRMIEGTHLHVSGKYLQNYVTECTLRYNNRGNQNGMFEAILKNLPEKD